MPAQGDIMAQHINSIMGRYKGRMHSVDVVNEAIYCKDGRADGLRETAWMRVYGADYVKRAFEQAPKLIPQPPWFITKNQLEYQGSYYDKRRTALFKLLDRLQGSNTPIHAVGLQSHLKLGREFNPNQFSRFVNDLHKRGLQVMLTELDIRNVGSRMTMDELNYKAAAHMQSYLEAALAGAPIRTIQCWGLRDQVTTADQATGDEGSTRRLLPFDKMVTSGRFMRPLPAL
jgi:endo-1,4-beta-xylanase